MKIKSIGLNLNGGRGLRTFLTDSGFKVKYFYDYSGIPVGTYYENLSGIESYLDSVDDGSVDVIIDFPINLAFKHAYEKDSDTKFICLQKDVEKWLDVWGKTMQKYASAEPYQFEEAFCKAYLDTSKTKISDLTEEELRTIYTEHYAAVEEFFKDKPNFLKVHLDDPQISAKLRTFFEITSDIEFDILSDEAAIA